ncbi:MAG: biotin/lipoyl-containing protein, partial [Actinomycetota bacterium]
MAEVTLPQLGETVTEGTITRWFKKVGDAVAADEPLFEVSTDKVDTEVPSPVAGVLVEIRVQEGDTVPVGAVIGVVGDAGAAPAAAPAPAAASAPAAEPAPAPAPVPAAAPAAAPTPAAPPAPAPAPAAAQHDSLGSDIVLSPVVRRLINENGLDVRAITGTGPGGRITRDDVLSVIEKGGARAVPAAAEPAPAAPAPAAPGRAAPTAPRPAVVAGARD